MIGWFLEVLAIVVELVAVYGIVGVFLVRCVQNTPGSATRARRLIKTLVAPFFLAVGTVQLCDRWQYDYPQRFDLFPLTRWAMFANAVDPQMESFPIYEWRGVTGRGDSGHLNPARLFLTPNATVLFTKTDTLGRRLADPSSGRLEEARHLTSLYAEGIRRAYNARVSSALEIQDVELWERTVPLVSGSQPPAPFQLPQSRRIFSLREGQP